MPYTLHAMNAQTQQHLIDLNRRFYDQFAGSFSDTRNRAQPGVRQLVPELLTADTILDVGCGNGTLACALMKAGYKGHYLGIDVSEGLLASARERIGPAEQRSYTFKQADLSDPNWAQQLPTDRFDALVSFAVLHHIPGQTLQLQIAQAFHDLVKPDGWVAVSVWQWQNSPRLAKRVVPWSAAGREPADVDEGDVLLDWRASDQVGLRYVHTFSESSLTQLAEAAHFKVIRSYLSDGKPGNLALYQTWQP
ncbi:MAG: methyltransferase domain-containing protein, partial [Anaerolineaceae bacterium]|nr:methyltransferase domain-containing protein [Anaerolineaceae bacterium]